MRVCRDAYEWFKLVWENVALVCKQRLAHKPSALPWPRIGPRVGGSGASVVPSLLFILVFREQALAHDHVITTVGNDPSDPQFQPHRSPAVPTDHVSRCHISASWNASRMVNPHSLGSLCYCITTPSEKRLFLISNLKDLKEAQTMGKPLGDTQVYLINPSDPQHRRAVKYLDSQQSCWVLASICGLCSVFLLLLSLRGC